MAEGLTTDLIFTATLTFLLGVLLLRKPYSFFGAIAISLLRTAIPTVYFAWFYDGSWNFLDDFTYLAQGEQLIGTGFNPFSILVFEEGRELLRAVAGGNHFLYVWWNFVAQVVLGENYYAPVFCNVSLLFVISRILLRGLANFGFEERYLKWYLIFFLFHWDLLVWSSFINLKDVLVLALTAASLLIATRLLAQPSIKLLIFFLLSLIPFFWLRYYIPHLMVLAITLAVLLQIRRRSALVVFIGIVLFALFVLPDSGGKSEYITTSVPVTNFLKFLLAPIPWKVVDKSSFLIIPSILNWLLFIPTVFSGIWLWRRVPAVRVAILYLATCTVFYALVEILLGPRLRVQVTFIIALIQFNALWHLFQRLKPRKY